MCVFLDLYNNEILENEVSDRNDLQLVIQPLKRLLTKRKKDVTDATTIHSDQGNQYTSKAYSLLLKQYGIKQSMSRKGTPLDNAPVESFSVGLKMNCIQTIVRKVRMNFAMQLKLMPTFITMNVHK
jgi:transposase InsO family protein